VTVAAAERPSYLEARLPKGTPVAWIMPNTAAENGKSISLYTMGQSIKEMHQETLQLLLRGIGTSHLCTEEEVHQRTAVTG
ncbi:pyrroline-5-carboxylate reductase family protein, partial [Bacillus paralicheniformis]|uniref:pyrroline-5-carboxylate reductase family protein n=1 Tax=Bacillus paralicheniformis TaxID=1648923 RepID=UPI0035DAAE1B